MQTPLANLSLALIFCKIWPKAQRSNIPQLPNPANWVAPTLNVEELDKRIDELKAVQFWLDQNAKALAPPSRRWKCKK